MPIKNNEKGFAHHIILPLLVIAVITAIGVHVLSKSNADAIQRSSSSSSVNNWGLVFSTPTIKHMFSDSPSPVPGLAGATAIQAGNSDGYAIINGNVWGWGYGVNGELGNGGTSNSFVSPVEATFPSGTTITAIGEAFDNGYAIDSSGHGWGWGTNSTGSLCLGTSGNGDKLTPQQITTMPTTVSAVAGGESHVLWLGTDGNVYGCGHQPYGQLGNGNTKTQKTPAKVQGLPAGDPVVAISAGDDFSAALTKSGKLFMWGHNENGQLGIGNTIDQMLPVQVPGTFSQVYCGGGSGANSKGNIGGVGTGHTVAITTSGTVEAWGLDASGQLGDGGTTNQSSPVPVQVPSGVTFTKVMAAGVTSAAIDSNGNVWTWGSGSVGQLGNGARGNQSFTPIEVDHGKTMLSGTASNIIDN